MIYDPSAHEPLTETPWDAGRAAEGIAAIVADAEASLADGGWPNHPLDDEDGDLRDRPTSLYLGSAGMIWALHRLGSSLDLASLADDALRRYGEQPDFADDPSSVWWGEAGILLVARIVGAAGADDERLRELVVENERNPTWELMWGSPGTMLAAREAGLAKEWRQSAAILVEEWERRGGLWTQELSGNARQFIGPAHGFVGNVHALRGYLDDEDLRSRIEPVLREHAVADGPFVNWPPVVGAERVDRVQWCHGAPGVVATVGDLMPSDLLLGGAELTWRAGPLAKGAGLCHGTAGNGYALLRGYTVTGDEAWLDRARRFAMHALEQVERARAAYGRGRYTLFTGDVGAALYARSCLDADPRFPTMDVW
ncbi:MAG TPA: LanC-like protein [Gaiellaceae bacterium]|nr:LanC-like protein [Gaiellaceae bacterium]